VRLIPNWKDVLIYGWNARLIALAAALTGLEVAVPYLDNLVPIPQGLFSALAGLCSAAALVARVIAQKGITPPATSTIEHEADE
jgi:hypothetical protein